MKVTKFAYRTVIAIGLSTLVYSSLFAGTIDVSKSKKDIKVMTRIIEASLESSGKLFPGHPRIKGTYLAKQGYLFNIQLNGLGSFGVPGLASWDDGRLELDIPEIVSSALASVDLAEVFEAEEYNQEMEDVMAPVMGSLEGLYDNEELQDKLRSLREKQREVRRETYQIRRDIRQAEDDNKRVELENHLEQKRQSLKQYSEDYSGALKTYKTERQARQVKKSTDAINAVFMTLCDYGQSLRAMKKGERFTLMIKGGLDNEGNKATQAYVIEQKALQNCSDSNNLKNKAIHYTL